MGTRSVICVCDGDKTYQVYKHWDGYPTENLALILNGIRNGGMLDVLTGGGGRVEAEYKAKTFRRSLFGNQGDLEWIYWVDLKRKEVRVWGGDYGAPEDHIAKGLTDPTEYANRLLPDYINRERDEIMAHMKGIISEGFKLNKLRCA